MSCTVEITLLRLGFDGSNVLVWHHALLNGNMLSTEQFLVPHRQLFPGHLDATREPVHVSLVQLFSIEAPQCTDQT